MGNILQGFYKQCSLSMPYSPGYEFYLASICTENNFLSSEDMCLSQVEPVEFGVLANTS